MIPNWYIVTVFDFFVRLLTKSWFWYDITSAEYHNRQSIIVLFWKENLVLSNSPRKRFNMDCVSCVANFLPLKQIPMNFSFNTQHQVNYEIKHDQDLFLNNPIKAPNLQLLLLQAVISRNRFKVNAFLIRVHQTVNHWCM